MDAFKTLLLGTPPTRTYTASATGLLTSANNLSDVADAATARTNIGVGNASNVTHATLTISGTTDSSSKDTGSIVTEGGLGVEKSATIGGNLTVGGTGLHTFASRVAINRADNTSATFGHVTLTRGSGAGNSASLVTTGDAANGVASVSIQTADVDRLTVTSAGTTLAGNLTVSGASSVLGAGTGVFRLTNGGGDIDSSFATASTSTADSVYVYSSASQSAVGFGVYNGTRRVAVAAVETGSTVDTAGSESASLVFKTKPSGGSLTTALTIDSTQNTTLAGNLTVSGTGTSALTSSSSSLVVGSSTATSTSAVGVPQITAESDLYSSLGSIAHNNTNGNHGFLLVGKSRGTKASPTILADGDVFGELSFVAYDGAAYRTSGRIRSVIAGTPGASDLPTALDFQVAPDASATAATAMRIAPTGNLILKSDGVDSGNGKLQLATHTTSAGGIGFGTDTSLYRQSAGRLAIDHIGGTQPMLMLRENGSTVAELQTVSGDFYISSATAGKSLFLRSGAGTTALTLDASQNIVPGTAALATTATNGFIYLQTCAGAPTGVPTSYTGRVASIYDTTNNKLYIYNGGWKSVTLA